jgi:hypothetical protein
MLFNLFSNQIESQTRRLVHAKCSRESTSKMSYVPLILRLYTMMVRRDKINLLAGVPLSYEGSEDALV